ncbi:unnamed protein product [Acanthoscelides obtectus]|uniref:Uncharacterized protein n=1 Tax=Acanthoscelides obtectus TaxID=200917 RepID=A0A9P0PCJ3_ACAOB|nr:unnamed protein product [Acanthoscelides obtectus]CAK1681705.1 hypothetical protein AOBTE_LOCUS33231 [Acanthoscelides obtectus]
MYFFIIIFYYLTNLDPLFKIFYLDALLLLQLLYNSFSK